MSIEGAALLIRCEHGFFDGHEYGSYAYEKQCPGGRPLTLTREWRCWCEDGSYYGPCQPEWEYEESWRHRHALCGWQLYVMEADT